MLQSIFGSESREQVLTYLVNNHEGYASEIARASDLDLYAVQQQLEKFESNGLLISWPRGRMRVYKFNPDYPLLAELKHLIEKSLSYSVALQSGKSPAPLPARMAV